MMGNTYDGKVDKLKKNMTDILSDAQLPTCSIYSFFIRLKKDEKIMQWFQNFRKMCSHMNLLSMYGISE